MYLRHWALDAGHGTQPCDHVVALLAEVLNTSQREVAVGVRDSGDARMLRHRGWAGRVVALHLGHGLDGAHWAGYVA